VPDRMVQQAVMQVLQSRWDAEFSEPSHGFRPERSAHRAVAKAQKYIAEGRGWVVDLDSVLETLDQWLRPRLRAVIWKQWKRGRVRFANLCALGVNRSLAARTAGSAHGPWRIANSRALSYAFPISYFDSLGLPRLRVDS